MVNNSNRNNNNNNIRNNNNICQEINIKGCTITTTLTIISISQLS